MIFKLVFEGDKIEWAQAKSQLHLLQSYLEENGNIHEIKEVVEVSEEEAKNIMLQNMDYDEEQPEDMPKEFSLFSAVCGDDFVIVGSTEWV